ncbi:hypothetical protein G8759_25280 [Spirosoma aureum]|uniref:Uncharacterized protein n=1 Tax=Spirosoma aureum TaxID=2692134 RepID=A0A6G9ATQ6_9BACT|nr:hypothetical protein [Spirosoma aureum]QIP15709.1 hypothetical protein G8759_25280 [Spirosoma aureum]
MTAQEVIKLIESAQTPEQIRAANQTTAEFQKTASPEDSQAVRDAFHRYVDQLIDDIDVDAEETMRFLALNGKQYKLEDWLTPAEYARKYELKTPNIVSNWIVRGIIPQEDVLTVPELNGMRLVRNRNYKETSTEVGS